MVKIGPGFFDSVSLQKMRGHRSFSNFTAYESLSIIPQILLVIFFLIILSRLFYIQILRGDYYSGLSDDNRTKTKVISAPRGIILDRFARPLVSNSARFNMVENGKKKSMPRNEALERITRGEQVASDVVREYTYKSDFVHVLGYVGQISEAESALPGFSEHDLSDWVGKIGLEQAYENILHGKNGKELFEVDSNGAIVRSLGIEEPVPGQNIRTTLDLNIGLSVASAMESVEKGAVVVSDPRNGGIYALYSRPSFDPNIFTFRLDNQTSGSSDFILDGEYETVESILADQEKQPLLNRAIGGLYPPGSTFKLITAVAALTNGTIKPSTIIEDTGILRVGEFSFGNWYFLQYGRTEGPLDIVRAIARSNDIFFYKAAESAGVEKISSLAREFGLGGKFGIDIAGESEGIVPSPSWKEKNVGEQWYLGDTYNYGIGQGYLLTTPLQVNVMASVFANGGTLYKPHLTSSHKKTLKNNFIKKEYIELVRRGMKESCEPGGVAWPFFDFKVENSRLAPDDKNYIKDASASATSTSLSAGDMVRITVGCKTGTAETGDKDTEPHAWITVFAPFYNPEVVVTVLIENGGEGSSVAGPIAKKILQDYFERK